MPDFVLSVWKAGENDADGTAIRLRPAGGGVALAEHGEGFDTSAILIDGAVVEAEASLSAAGLMDGRRAKAVGDVLWRRLTPGDIGGALAPLAGRERIYLDLRSPELSRYPWELLRLSDQFIFPAGGTRWSLGRPEPTEHFVRGTPPADDHPLRVLVVIGNRPDDTRIRAEQELLVIERAAHRHNAEVLLTALRHPGADTIERTLTDFRPHVFHFIGHGGGDPAAPPRIYVHANGQSDPWDADRIRTVFSQSPPRVVVLNACQTAHAPTEASSLARAFADAGCITTVTMMGEIRGTASVAFSERFYRELFQGTAVDLATSRARLTVGMIAGGDGDAGVLQLRSNWALPRITVRGDAGTAITMRHAADPAMTQWLAPDFVVRWDERWRAWRAMDGTHRGADGTEARLAVLYGAPEAGKRELMNTLAEAWARAGAGVVFVQLAGAHTGGWRDILQKIADAAAKAGFDASGLRATAGADGTSATVIARFRADLEELGGSPGHPAEPLLIVLDGLSDWTADEVAQTVLPELCRPFVRAPARSRLRMMISLRDRVSDELWGLRPAGWQPIPVGSFESEEWKRAIKHFCAYWTPRVPEGDREAFAAIASAMAGAPYASGLGYLRGFGGDRVR